MNETTFRVVKEGDRFMAEELTQSGSWYYIQTTLSNTAEEARTRAIKIIIDRREREILSTETI